MVDVLKLGYHLYFRRFANRALLDVWVDAVMPLALVWPTAAFCSPPK